MADTKSDQEGLTVVSLADVMKRRNQYPEAHAFIVAPLKTHTGARSWRGIDGTGRAWGKVGMDGVVFPSVDAGTDVPPLPPSPLNMWEVGFTDSEGNMLRPTLTIDPAFKTKGQAEGASDSSTGQRGAAADPNTAKDLLLLELIREKDRHALMTLKGAQEAQAGAVSLVIGLSKHYQEALSESQATRKLLEEQLRELVGTNAELSNKLQEQMQKGQMHETLRVLFQGKPELLIDSGRELITAILEKLKE